MSRPLLIVALIFAPGLMTACGSEAEPRSSDAASKGSPASPSVSPELTPANGDAASLPLAECERLIEATVDYATVDYAPGDPTYPTPEEALEHLDATNRPTETPEPRSQSENSASWIFVLEGEKIARATARRLDDGNWTMLEAAQCGEEVQPTATPSAPKAQPEIEHSCATQRPEGGSVAYRRAWTR